MNRFRALSFLTLAVLVEMELPRPAFAQAVPDRYGAASYGAPSAFAPAPGAAPTRLRMLSWPGKAAAPRPADYAATPAPRAAPANRYAGMDAYARPAAAPAAYAAGPGFAADPRRSWVAVGPGAAEPSLAGAPPPAAPTSIYDAPPRPTVATASAAARPPLRGAAGMPPPRYRTAASDDPSQRNVRFYSLHRQYGLQPDPAPIPPQFFAATADLSEPAGPLPVQRFTSGSGASATTRTVRGSDATDATAQQ